MSGVRLFVPVRVRRRADVLLAHLGAVQIYYTEPDHDAYARSAKEADEVVDFLAGTTNRWAFGQCQTMRERMTLRVPGANYVSSNVPGCGRPDLCKAWIRHISVQHEADVLFVMVQATVYGFSLASGERMLTWDSMHSQRICQVRMSRTRMLIRGGPSAALQMRMCPENVRISLQWSCSFDSGNLNKRRGHVQDTASLRCKRFECCAQVLYMPDIMRIVTASEEPRVTIWISRQDLQCVTGSCLVCRPVFARHA